ncbi:MAG: phospholipase [Chloroflexi bacterium]|nr:MAG: phospholipase [Chloroflexota bacterium]
MTDPLAAAARLSSVLFLPVRKLVGPLHRRGQSIEKDQNNDLPPLPEPWEDERWFRGGFPPRGHNALEPLLHGDEYFNDLYEALLAARERVTICGWSLTPLMALLRGKREGESILVDVLRRASERAEVYVLLWSGAPALFEPTDRMAKDVQKILNRYAPKVRCELDHRASFSHDHHQKAVTIDGHLAFVGGMDLSTFQGDRWDTSEHPLRFGPGWHDVQVRIRGELVSDVEENFCQRWNVVTGERLEPLSVKPIEPAGSMPAQIVRTVPAGFFPFAPHGEFGIYHVLTSAIRRARRYVYLENQYLWSPEVVDALVDAMNRNRSGPFRIVVVLPAKAYTGKYDNDEHVRLLSHADRGRGIFHAFSLYSGGPAMGTTGYRYLPIYVHAKVSIVDDEWFSVGSANLNGRGLATDTEMNVHAIVPSAARHLRVRLWAEHLGVSVDQIADADPIALVDTQWPEAAKAMEASMLSGGFPAQSQIRRYVPGHNPGSRLLDVIQQMTLEH